MTLFEGYTVEELDKVLRISKWLGGVCVMGGVLALFFGHWMLHRIAEMQVANRIEIQKRLAKAEETLGRSRVQNAEIVATLDRLSSPLTLSQTQASALAKNLPAGVKDKIIFTYSAVDPDAPTYALKIVEIFQKGGLNAELSDIIQLEFPQPGLFIASAVGERAGNEPIAQAFQAAGIKIAVVESEAVRKTVQAKPGEIVIAVGHVN